jgi:hypothetical protein
MRASSISSPAAYVFGIAKVSGDALGDLEIAIVESFKGSWNPHWEQSSDAGDF